MNIKMKSRSHRYYINRPRSRRWHKYKKHEKRLAMIMFTRMLCTMYAMYNAKTLSNTEAEWKKKTLPMKKCESV